METEASKEWPNDTVPGCCWLTRTELYHLTAVLDGSMRREGRRIGIEAFHAAAGENLMVPIEAAANLIASILVEYGKKNDHSPREMGAILDLVCIRAREMYEGRMVAEDVAGCA